jgi:quercetin dioxygenase-like cupin family protein
MNVHRQDTNVQQNNEDILTNAAALALGAVLPQEALEICREIGGSSSATIKEYQRMVWTTHHLPAALPMVQPPPALKQDVMKKIRSNSTPPPRQSEYQRHTHHAEFIPEFDAGGMDFYAILGTEGPWLQHPVKGITVKPLARDKERGYATLLMRLEADTVFPSHSHAGSEQCYILSGSVNLMGRVLQTGDFFSTQADADHGDIISPEGAMVLLVVALEDYRKSAWQVGWNMAKERVKGLFS